MAQPSATASPTKSGATGSVAGQPEGTLFGTRRESTGNPTTSVPLGLSGVFQMVLALAIVGVGVRYALPKWLPAIGRLKIGSGPYGEITILETRPIPNGNLYLIEARGRTLLIAGNQTGVTLVSDLTPPPIVDSEPAAPSEFDHILLRAQPRAPSPEPDDPAPIRAGVSDALERLKTLSER